LRISKSSNAMHSRRQVDCIHSVDLSPNQSEDIMFTAVVCLHQLLVDLHLHSKDCFGNAVFARVRARILKRLARFPSTFKRCCLTLFFQTFLIFTLDCYWNIAVSWHGTGNLRQELGTVCPFHSLTFRCHTEEEARTRQCFAETLPIGNIHWPEFEERVLQPDVIYWPHERRSRAPHFSVIVLLPPLNQNSGKPISVSCVAAYFANKQMEKKGKLQQAVVSSGNTPH